MRQVTDPHRFTKTSQPAYNFSSDIFPGYTSAGNYYDPNAEDRLNARLDDLRSLPDNWDGYGASTPDAKVIDAVEIFCRRSISHPNTVINPTCDGGIQLEWQNRGKYLEIEFSPDDEPSFTYWDGDPANAVEGNLHSLLNSDPYSASKLEEQIQNMFTWLKSE